MTRDAITEGNRILNNIKVARDFWENHVYKHDIPNSLISKIDSTIEEYIADMEQELKYLRDYFKYENDEK